MNRLNAFTCLLSLLAAAYFSRTYTGLMGWLTSIPFAALAFVALRAKHSRARPVVRLKGLAWSREDFCRGWLITGDTGSGKTRSGITQLLFQVFQSEPRWGGLCIDDKGVYWETLKAMAGHFNRANDLILLQVKPEGAGADWKPPNTYNLTSDRKIPFTGFGKFIVDTATSLGQQGDKAFFKSQAQMQIALALEALYETRVDVTLENAHELLLNESALNQAIGEMTGRGKTARQKVIIEHFVNRYAKQPPEQLGGVKETIANYLHCFLTPDIAQIFCSATNTFDFSDIDRGKIICVVMPQKFQAERRYVNTFLKMLFYTHVLRRFDKPIEDRADDNLLILWADEAQHFVTASEDGMSDYNCIDVMREAKATVVAAAQSTTSFLPALGVEKARVLTLNLRNRMIFKAADEAGAVESADFLGQRKVVKRSWGFSGGNHSRNFHEQDEHKIKPYVLRHLRKHQCVLVHCEKGFKKTLLPPLEPDGTVSSWFKRQWF